MSEQTVLSEVSISDGHGGKTKVRSGDRVELAPLVLDDACDPSVKYQRTHAHEANIMRLGEGPYVVNAIKEWPFGCVTLYLSTQNGLRGVDVPDLQAVIEPA
jgi:hypothetical protein